MKQIIFILLFFTTVNHAQVKGDIEEDYDSRQLTQAQLKNAIILYDKMIASDYYIEWQKLHDILYSIESKEQNLLSFFDHKENINEEKIQDWVNKNVLIKNKKETIALLSKIVFVENKINIENSTIGNL